MSKKLYILVCQTETTPAKMFKLITKVPYNHSSISLDHKLDTMYSFCRNNSKYPLPAGFNREVVGQGTLQLFPHIPCELYEIKVTEEQYDHALSVIEEFKRNRSEYSYNILGLLPIKLKIKLNRSHKFVCSQFVAHILQACSLPLEKDASLYTPDDFRYLECAKLIYTGELNSYYKALHGEN